RWPRAAPRTVAARWWTWWCTGRSDRPWPCTRRRRRSPGNPRCGPRSPAGAGTAGTCRSLRRAGARPSRLGRRGRCGGCRFRPAGQCSRGCSSCGLLGVGALPAAVIGRTGLDGCENALDLQRLLEGRRGVGALADRLDQVGDLVAEGVLVAQAVACGPPVGRVGVLGLGGQDAGEALAASGGGGVVDLQLVHALEVEGDRALR